MFAPDRAALVAKGEALWNFKSLPPKGKLVCASCHKDNVKQFEMTFLEPDPHAVKMVQKRADFDSTLAEGMVAAAAVMPSARSGFRWNQKPALERGVESRLRWPWRQKSNGTYRAQSGIPVWTTASRRRTL